MRDIPLVNLFNYSYTFDRLIVDLYYGLNEDFGQQIIASFCESGLEDEVMADLPLNPEVDTGGKIINEDQTRSMRKSVVKSTRELFVALLINPYRKVWTDEEYQFLDAIFRGSGNLPLDRPKFLSDQVYGKLMFRDAFGYLPGDPADARLIFNTKFERGPSHHIDGYSSDDKTLNYIRSTAESKDSNDYEFNKSDIKYVAVNENLKKMLQLIGKLRFNTRFIRNLFFLVNLYRSLRLKLRMDLTYSKNIVVKSHAVVRPDNTEFRLNQSKRDRV